MASSRAVPLCVALLGALAGGCGARSELSGDAPPGGPTDELPPPPECADAPDPPPAVSCSPLQLDFPVQAACEIARPDCAPVDAEGFASLPACPICFDEEACRDVPREPHRVLVLNRLGAGHVIGWCDSTTLIGLMNALRAAAYLGQSAAPRVASVGKYPCDGVSDAAIPGVTYLGPALPAELADDPAVLAASFDVLVACGARADFGDAFAPTVLSFVRDHGRGLLAVFDYVCPNVDPAPALDQLNAVVGHAGFVFEAPLLGWGSGSIEAACVADYPP
jgi:hypothetical protein